MVPCLGVLVLGDVHVLVYLVQYQIRGPCWSQVPAHSGTARRPGLKIPRRRAKLAASYFLWTVSSETVKLDSDPIGVPFLSNGLNPKVLPVDGEFPYGLHLVIYWAIVPFCRKCIVADTLWLPSDQLSHPSGVWGLTTSALGIQSRVHDYRVSLWRGPLPPPG